MKINLTRKQWGLVVLLIIVVPILYNKLAGAVTGIIQKRMMSIPKEVVIDKPGEEEVLLLLRLRGELRQNIQLT